MDKGQAEVFHDADRAISASQTAAGGPAGSDPSGLYSDYGHSYNQNKIAKLSAGVTALMDTDSLQHQTMAELLQEAEPPRGVRYGEIVEVSVIRVDTDAILVNLGHKWEGIIRQQEMRSLPSERFAQLAEGDTLLAYVLQPAGDDGEAVLSLDRARGEQGWRTLERRLEDSGVVEGKIVGFNKGGAVVDVDGVQGFVPLSQLAPIPREGGNNHEALTKRVGETVSLKVLEVNRRRNRAVLSERNALQEQRDRQKERLMESLKEGEVQRGRVTGVSSFGAFVDLGGADGLIHVSEMCWTPVRDPRDVVQVGSEVDVYVLRVDREAKRIALSLKRLQPEPWEALAERYSVGQTVVGTVTKLVNFGAFARVEGAVEGLIHISELSDRHVQHPKEVVKEGDVLTLRIVSLDPQRRRLGLSLKQAEDILGG
ncbi:MAG: S1 RNA-binding domain-containing protein [Chloroflexi bacterium]|nr:S1 RNA-binding domain-containing protein [Chloroflexota bacterium]